MNSENGVVQEGGTSWNFLLVDAEIGVANLLRAAVDAAPAASPSKTPAPGKFAKSAAPSASPSVTPSSASVRCAEGVAAAEAEMLRKPADVLFVNVHNHNPRDHTGTQTIARLKERFPRTDIIALARAKRTDLCLDAFRAGASDMLLAPFGQKELRQALDNLSLRRMKSGRLAQRHQRLREVCRRLNRARHEISQQVDLLCNDLVRAYQEMAQQLNLTQTAADFAHALGRELDVEGVLRKTMEWILMKLGPVNAAIYLPSGDGPFALGAYLNLDTQADALLIESLGRTIIEQARGKSPVWIEDDRMLEDLFGDDARPLVGRQWLAVGCHSPRDCLAVLTVFHVRRPGESAAQESAALAGAARGLMEAIAPILAERIEQALGLYQRLHPFPDEDPEEN